MHNLLLYTIKSISVWLCLHLGWQIDSCRHLAFLMLTQAHILVEVWRQVYSDCLSLSATISVGIWYTKRRDWILMALCKKNLEHKVWNWRTLLPNVFPQYEGIHFLVSRVRLTNFLEVYSSSSPWMFYSEEELAHHPTKPLQFDVVFIWALKYLDDYEEGAIHGNLVFADHR